MKPTQRRISRLARLENAMPQGPTTAICTYPLTDTGLFTARLPKGFLTFETEAAMFADLTARGVSVGLYVPNTCAPDEWEAAANTC